jgi:photoactive yellow protein
MLRFDSTDIFDALLNSHDDDLDKLAFGVVGLDKHLVCLQFNAYEQEKSGLSASRVISARFFEQVAPCMNNFLVADRLADNQTLDETLDYTLSIRVKPTPAKLRLLAKRDETRRFLLIQWPDLA